MEITRIYTGDDNESHFEDVDVSLVDTGGIDLGSEFIKVTGITFREMYANATLDWHNAPRRQFVITLEGEGEIEISDGTKRRFGPGDVLLAEDTTGKGHITRVVNNKPRKTAFVALD